jgi:uncharacterized protein (TIGR02145 family)
LVEVETTTVVAGTFLMGCQEGRDGDCRSDEELHEVTLTFDLEVDVHEVTQRDYEARMGENPSGYGDCPDCPVENLNWHEAAAYANQRSDDDRLGRCYECSSPGGYTRCSPIEGSPPICAGWRLPTEAEWEYAARCGEDTMYAGSDELAEVAWYWENSEHRPAPGGGLAPSACGLMDMSGNVWEMVSDGYDSTYYSWSPDTDPTGSDSSSDVVFRGGSSVSHEEDSRGALRNHTGSTTRNTGIGFRLVRSLL